MTNFFFTNKDTSFITELECGYNSSNFQNILFYFDKAYLYTYMSNLLLIYFMYMFFKLILLSSIVELMWPTHYFNKKHNISHGRAKNRSFLESFLKLLPTSSYLVVLNVALFRYFKF